MPGAQEPRAGAEQVPSQADTLWAHASVCAVHFAYVGFAHTGVDELWMYLGGCGERHVLTQHAPDTAQAQP